MLGAAQREAAKDIADPTNPNYGKPLAQVMEEKLQAATGNGTDAWKAVANMSIAGPATKSVGGQGGGTVRMTGPAGTFDVPPNKVQQFTANGYTKAQ